MIYLKTITKKLFRIFYTVIWWWEFFTSNQKGCKTSNVALLNIPWILIQDFNTSREIPHLLATSSSINGELRAFLKAFYLTYDTKKIISLLELNCWYTLSRVCVCVSEGYARAEQTMYRVTRPPRAIVSCRRWMWKKGGCPTSNFSSHRLWESGGWPSLWKVRDTFPLFFPKRRHTFCRTRRL